MTKCEICQKPQSPYPNWLLSKDHGYHVGCLAIAYEELRQAHKALALEKWTRERIEAMERVVKIALRIYEEEEEQNEDRIDAEIARQRLNDIRDHPERLVTGATLEERLRR